MLRKILHTEVTVGQKRPLPLDPGELGGLSGGSNLSLEPRELHCYYEVPSVISGHWGSDTLGGAQSQVHSCHAAVPGTSATEHTENAK